MTNDSTGTSLKIPLWLLASVERWFAIRQRSKQELIRYLSRKKISGNPVAPEVIDAIVTRYIDLGIINDTDFAKNWSEQRLRSKQKGPLMLVAELRAKGVDSELIKNAVKDLPQEDIVASAKHYLKKNQWKLEKLDPFQAKQKKIEMLSRRGYSFQHITEALKLD